MALTEVWVKVIAILRFFPKNFPAFALCERAQKIVGDLNNSSQWRKSAATDAELISDTNIPIIEARYFSGPPLLRQVGS